MVRFVALLAAGMAAAATAAPLDFEIVHYEIQQLIAFIGLGKGTQLYYAVINALVLRERHML